MPTIKWLSIKEIYVTSHIVHWQNLAMQPPQTRMHFSCICSRWNQEQRIEKGHQSSQNNLDFRQPCNQRVQAVGQRLSALNTMELNFSLTKTCQNWPTGSLPLPLHPVQVSSSSYPDETVATTATSPLLSLPHPSQLPQQRSKRRKRKLEN